MSTPPASSTQPVQELEVATNSRQLVRFAYRYMASQWHAIAVSALFMAGATLLSIAIPALAEEIVSYGTETVTNTMRGAVPPSGGGNTINNFSTSAAASSASADTVSASQSAAAAKQLSFLGLGPLSERLFRPFLPLFFGALRGADTTMWPSAYVEGVLCRCLLMSLATLVYHFTSLLAHLAAYYAGIGAQSTLTEDSVHCILHTPQPERVAIVNAVKLAQLITASGRALSDTMGELLTNVLSQVMYAIGFFVVMLVLSYQLTLTILVGVIGIQCLFFFQGRSLHRQGSRVTAEETSVQAYIANILQRSQTIFVFKCSDFVLKRMAGRLAQVRQLTNGLNRSIHGYAAISSALTRLILVLALGLSNYYQQKGQLDMRHTILYFACFQSFVNTLVSLSAAEGQLRATLGRLKTLEAMLRWYAEQPLPRLLQDSAQPIVHVQEEATAPVQLEDVSFAYPAVPRCFSEAGSAEGEAAATVAVLEAQLGEAMGGSRHHNGVANVSFSAAVSGITALYGPSGSGKSTCLRLLCGLVRPHSGTVHTHRRAVLLEQQHAIFIGTVAENILLADLTGLGDGAGKAGDFPSTTAVTSPPRGEKASATELQRRVMDASVKSGCSGFLSNPFSTFIESVDHPQFSGGQLQRISLARIFAQTAGYSLVLLDEPTTGLDRSAVAVLLETIKELRDTHGKTVLISTHDQRVAEVADKVIDLSVRAAAK